MQYAYMHIYIILYVVLGIVILQIFETDDLIRYYLAI